MAMMMKIKCGTFSPCLQKGFTEGKNSLSKSCSSPHTVSVGNGRRSNWIPHQSFPSNPIHLAFASARLQSLTATATLTLGENNGHPSTEEELGLLDACDDEYDGVVVDPKCLPSSQDSFAAVLRSSLACWRKKGKKGIWLKVLADQSDLVPVAVKAGFRYHHAEPGYVMLACWIPDEPCLLPANASHQVGVGGFVINENREILVVQERQCNSMCSGVWKIPTGVIHKSEEIFSGAIREVKEETGIETEFVEVIAFRHAHNVAFEKSDLYFICMLRPLSSHITVDGVEIQAAKWMPIDEFLGQWFHQDDPMSIKVYELCLANVEGRYRGLVRKKLHSKFDEDIQKGTRKSESSAYDLQTYYTWRNGRH